mmetsp:Transcript_34241/g.82795  ORF Transcript_34241/g.82795 Transcript_34241/m.82795 type:complete len:536 (+) Transcript_34241:155-1762(+)
MPQNIALCGAIAIPMAGVISYLSYQGFKTGAHFEISVTMRPHNIKPHIRTSTSSNTGNLPSNTRSDMDWSDIPDCAKDVFVALHNKKADGEDSCRGLLIRDDIIVTSKECSESSFTFDFAGVGILDAVPHAFLNYKALVADSRLGFLEANPPYHHYFVDVPVRRTRMFLSLQSGHGNGTAALMTCNDRKPIAHNFLVGGEMIPLGELDGVVPPDILWEHTDIYTAVTLRHHHERWWTREISKKDEEDTFRRMLDDYQGPPGSISIPNAHDDFTSRAKSLCEVVDPRGHRWERCFRNYFVRWQNEEPFSGMHFFDWLDFGHGNKLLDRNRIEHFLPDEIEYDEKCDREYFNSHLVHYFGDEERKLHEIYIEPSKDGAELIARYKVNGEPVPESPEGKPHLYMWDLDQTFYVVDHRFNKETLGGAVKHTGLNAGRPALSGGKAYFGKHGAIWGINYSSGHYRPNIEAVTMMYSWMKEHMGFNVTALNWVGRTSWSTEDCVKTDWNGIDIPGFEDVSALDRACHEVTVSPTWVLKEDV